jgi:dienelactone hydrolase
LESVAPSEALAAYRVPEERFRITLGAVSESARYLERAASFPSPRKSRWGTIHGTYYTPRGLEQGERVPAAVVVHHLGGSFEAEDLLAKHLAQHGMSAFFISLPNYGKRQEPQTKQGFLRFTPEVAFDAFQQAALDVIRAGDFLRSRPEVDSERVGVVGVSLGAFVTAVARGVDPRLRRTVLILGGGDLYNMFGQIPQASTLIEKSGLEPSHLSKVLTKLDPLTFAQRIATADVLMLNAKRDEIVPRSSTDALWNALGRPQIRWYDCGHYGVVLHLLSVMNATLDHLKGRSVY